MKKVTAVIAIAGLALAACAVGAFVGGQSTRMADDEVDAKVAAAVQGADDEADAKVAAAIRREDARSDRAQAIVVERVKATMDRRADRRAARAREAGYERGTSDAEASAPTPVTPAGTPASNYTPAQLDSFAEGGDGSHDGEGYATGEGCSDNPALPMPSC